MMLYMRVTRDRFELPLCVEDSPQALADKMGVKRESVASMCCKRQAGYRRVEVEDDWFPDNDGGLWRYDKNGKIERRD